MMIGAVFVLLNESHVTQVIQTSHGLAYPTLGYNNPLNQARPILGHCDMIRQIAFDADSPTPSDMWYTQLVASSDARC